MNNQQKAKAKKGKKKSKSSSSSSQTPSNHKVRGGLSIFGDRKTIASNTTTVPVAFNTFQGNVTFSEVRGVAYHSKEGLNGITLMGCQPLADVGTVAADTNILITSTLSSAGFNSIRISPDEFNGPLAAQANLHSRYVFRDILIEYISTVATSQANSFCMAIDEDPVGGNAPTSFSLTRQIVPNIVAPFRADRAYLHYHYSGENLWYTELDSATIAGDRLTEQGRFSMWPNAAAGGAITYGYTNVYYIIELYQSVSSRGFTLMAETKLVRDAIKNFLLGLKAGKLLILTSSFEIVEQPKPSGSSKDESKDKGWFQISR